MFLSIELNFNSKISLSSLKNPSFISLSAEILFLLNKYCCVDTMTTNLHSNKNMVPVLHCFFPSFGSHMHNAGSRLKGSSPKETTPDIVPGEHQLVQIKGLDSDWHSENCSCLSQFISITQRRKRPLPCKKGYSTLVRKPLCCLCLVMVLF